MCATAVRLETKIFGSDTKETMIDKDQQSNVRTLKWLQELNEELERYHYSGVELMEDTVVLAEEQDMLDEFDNKMENIMGGLNTLKTVSEPIASPAMATDTEHWEVGSELIRSQ